MDRRIEKYHKMAGSYSNANGGVRAQAIDPNDRTLTVNIAPIDSTVVGRARIFGGNAGLDETYNTAQNMAVTIPESSHNYVKNNSIGNPFRIKGILYTVSTALQLPQPFEIIKQSMAGASNQRTWQPTKYTAPTNFNDKQIKTSELQLVVDGDTRIEIDFLVGATASAVFTISDKAEVAQILSNRVPVKSAR
jgi:hypothetical protein